MNRNPGNGYSGNQGSYGDANYGASMGGFNETTPSYGASDYGVPMGAGGGANPPAAPRKSKTPMIVGIVIGIVVVIALVVAGLIWFQYDSSQKARSETHPLVVAFTADGYTDQCTKIPVSIKGADADDNAVDTVAFIDQEGRGIALSQGKYTLSFPASPLTPDGVLYLTPTSEISVTIGTDLKSGDEVTATEPGDIVFTRSTALEESDEMIEEAYTYACRDEAQKARADELKAVAEKAHSDAVAEEQARLQAEEQRKAAEEARARAASQPYTYTGTIHVLTSRELFDKAMPNGRWESHFDKGKAAVLEFDRETPVTAETADSGNATRDSIMIVFWSTIPGYDLFAMDGQQLMISAPPDALWWASEASAVGLQPTAIPDRVKVIS